MGTAHDLTVKVWNSMRHWCFTENGALLQNIFLRSQYIIEIKNEIPVKSNF